MFEIVWHCDGTRTHTQPFDIEKCFEKNRPHSADDKVAVSRARRIQKFLSQPNFVAEQFTGRPGKYVPLEDTIKGFEEILEGKYDHIPESAFYMKGNIEDVLQDSN